MTITAIHVRTRDTAIDRLRGLAILAMILDHVLLVTDILYPLRMTVGRIAMPLFFVISGHLVSRYSSRLFLIGLAGLMLPGLTALPIDNPNVLFLYAISAPIIILFRRNPTILTIIVLISFLIFANYGFTTSLGGFHPAAVLGIMAFGKLIPRERFSSGSSLPKWFETFGRFPLTIYISHILLLGLFL